MYGSITPNSPMFQVVALTRSKHLENHENTLLISLVQYEYAPQRSLPYNTMDCTNVSYK